MLEGFLEHTISHESSWWRCKGVSPFFSGCHYSTENCQDEEELFPMEQPRFVSVMTQEKLNPNPALTDQVRPHIYIYLLPSVMVVTLATDPWNRLTQPNGGGDGVDTDFEM